jgi:hypothetical protein
MTMNPTPDHLDDETLSAMLDSAAGEGHVRAAAAHLPACDLCAGRQAEFRAARAALATVPVEPLDELTRRRLVAAALQATEEGPAVASGVATLRSPGRGRWLQRHPALIGSVAAVLLGLLVGVPFVVGDGDGSDRTLSAQGPAELRDESAGTFLGDLGDLADQGGLRLRLSGGESASDTYAYAPTEPVPSPAGGGLAGSSARSASPPVVGTTADGSAEKAPAGLPATADATTTNAEQLSSGPEAGRDTDRDRADADTCVTVLLDGPARTGHLLRSGVGTYRGRPAVVASFELGGGTVAFVADRAGCAVLDRFAV